MSQEFEGLDTEEGHRRLNDALFGSAKGVQGPQGNSPVAAKIGGKAKTVKGAGAPLLAMPEIDAIGGAQTIGAGVLKYRSLIWATADTLRGTGVKESDWPRYMAPFFALALVESRIKRLRAEKIAEFEQDTGGAFDPKNPNHMQWLQGTIQNEGYGYHPDVAGLGVGLAEIVKVKTGNFLAQLESYLKQFDPETRRILGVDYAPGQPKFLDIKGVAGDLASRPNEPLYTFCAGAGSTPGWAHIDLVGFDNSEVTTLEEHIKRMWADISAETAGEQYTPKDIIELACALGIEARRANTNSEQICDVYDMACGGGNFLFAAEEALRREFPGLSVRVRGQELNDALYALAALEARFRPDAKIEWGNTLTHDHFLGSKFGMIVANPPYGVDWKAFASTIKASNCGRFSTERMPPTSDGQLLFMQHAVFHLDQIGVAAIVHSGSTLFSGDAGRGESETRRWLLQDLDVVEAIVQLPKNEFFNTGIATYLWILNRSKPTDRKGKVLLINTESCATKLKKNLNQKNCEINAANRARIVDCFKSFTDSDISKVVDVDDLLYNKVTLELHRHDEQGRAVQAEKKFDAAAIQSVDVAGEVWALGANGRFTRAGGCATEGNKSNPRDDVAAFAAALADAEHLAVRLQDGTAWAIETETRQVRESKGGVETEHGLGVLRVVAKVGKAKGQEVVRWEAAVAPLIETDTESIPYSSRKSQKGDSMNEIIVSDFIQKWISDPVLSRVTTVGCEINFNRIFPAKLSVRTTAAIARDIAEVDRELATFQKDLRAVQVGGPK
jgi:type I restriction enzyme M protein